MDRQLKRKILEDILSYEKSILRNGRLNENQIFQIIQNYEIHHFLGLKNSEFKYLYDVTTRFLRRYEHKIYNSLKKE